MSDVPLPATRMPAGQLALLSTALFAAVTTELIPIGLLPQLSSAFGVSPARIGWWTSTYALVVAVGAIPLTGLVGRFPRRRVLLALLGCYVLSNLLVLTAGAVGSYPLALGARVLGGLAHAAFFSVVIATAVRISPAGRSGRAVSVVSAGVMAAFAFGVPLATTAGTRLGWQAAFLGTAALLLVLLVAAAVLLPREGLDEPRPSAQTSAQTSAATAPRGAGAGGRRALVLVGAFSALFLLGHTTAYTYVTGLLRRSGVGADAVGPLLLAFGSGALVGVAVVSRVADARPTAALRVSGGVMAACLVALSLPPAAGAAGAVTAAVVLVVWGAAYGGLPAMLQTAGLRVTADPAAAPAVVNATTNAGIAAGAWLGGLVLPLGTGAVAATAAVVVLLALALTLAPGAGRPAAATPTTATRDEERVTAQLGSGTT